MGCGAPFMASGNSQRVPVRGFATVELAAGFCR